MRGHNSTVDTTQESDASDLRRLRVAIVHDYLNQRGGAEKVAEVFAEMFPAAPIYTSVYNPDPMPDFWRARDVRTSFMQRLRPRLGVAKALFPLYPTAFESFDFRSFDIVLSSTTAFAKGVITRPDTCHICYCNNPTRFLWMYRDYVAAEQFPLGLRFIVPWLVSPLRVWDFAAAQRVDYFVAGSHNASRRIAKYYRRDSRVVQPPIDCTMFRPEGAEGNYYLVVSRLQPYKRIELAVRACSRLNVPLRVVGDGPDRYRLQRMAGPTVQFYGRLSDEETRLQMSGCRALIFPGEEDFGLTPLEVQACGRPVVAYRAGGALETVIEGKTGAFFTAQSVESLVETLQSFRDEYDPEVLRQHALRFDKPVFMAKMYTMIAAMYRNFCLGEGADIAS